jgi:hypothetical protein
MFYHQDDQTPYDVLSEKWSPLLEHDALPDIGDQHKKQVTAVLLENQERAMKEQMIAEAAPTNAMGGGFSVTQAAASAGNLAGYDPILISLVRRAMPNLMAYDVCGVQPMTAPTGLIFALRSRYDSQTGSEALFQEPQSKFSGSIADVSVNGPSGASANPFGGTGSQNFGRNTLMSTDFRAMTTTNAEQLGTTGGAKFQQMAFSIERIAVEAKTRALKAEYSTELAQDLKAVHGLDAETELANILSTEILSEINREVIRTVYNVAKLGAKQADLSGTAAGKPGIYNLAGDSDGRWSAERFRGLMFQIEREANRIAKETRRGKGNFIVTTADVASALAMGGFLNISPALNTNLDVDDTGNTFAGVLNGKMRVYIDPYAAGSQGEVVDSEGTNGVYSDYVTVGYRGTSPYDAGFFYCPYVPLQMVRAVGEDTFQPKIGFKTRYGMVANPFAQNTDLDVLGGNQYYRIFAVQNLHGNGS